MMLTFWPVRQVKLLVAVLMKSTRMLCGQIDLSKQRAKSPLQTSAVRGALFLLEILLSSWNIEFDELLVVSELFLDQEQ